MLVPRKALNGLQTTSAQCVKEAERKIFQMTVEIREIAERAFQSYGRPLDMVSYFKYLGHILTDLDDNWLSVVGNLWKARNIWPRLLIIMGREGAINRLSGILFKAVVQAVFFWDGYVGDEPPQGPAYVGVHHPRIRPKTNCLYHCLE